MPALRESGRQKATAILSATVVVLGTLVAPPASALPATGSGVRMISAAAAAPGAAPTLTVTPIATGLNIPWDLFFTPDRTMVYNQRAGGLWARKANGSTTTVQADFSDLLIDGEVGLMGMTADPDFVTNRTFYTCQGHVSGAARDVRVIRWSMNAGYTAATRVGAPVVSGIEQSANFHAGCRLKFDQNKLLYISTGDTANGLAPQDLGGLNGKVLRVQRNGQPPGSNPFFGSTNAKTRLVYTRGHRNPQGLSLRPGTVDEMWSVEQGTDRDDEVNRLVPGGNYGWNPVRPPSTAYDQGTPMTNTSLPGAISAVFATGFPTLALSGGTWLSGTQWGRWNGAFMAVALKDSSARVLSLSGRQTVVKIESPAELIRNYRLRSPLQGPDGSLYLTTSNGNRTDQIWRVTPSAGPGDGRCYDAAVDPASPVAVVRTGTTTNGYVVGTNGALFERSIEPSAGFTDLGGIILYGPGAATWDGVRTDIFVVGNDSGLFHRFKSNGIWSGWDYLGGVLTSSPAVVSFSDGTLDVFARGTDLAMWTIRWTGSGWSGWTSMGGILSGSPGAAVDRDTGTGRVGVRGINGELFELPIRPGGQFGSYAATGIPICSAPSYSARTGDGESFTWATSDASGSTSVLNGTTVTQLGGILLGSPAIAASTGSGYAVLGRGNDGSLFVYDARTGPGAWRGLGGQIR